MIALVISFLVSIVFSFLCSIWEAVLLSITPSYVEIKRKEPGNVGKLLVGFKEQLDRPLSAILSLNTIAHTAGAIGVGTAATKLWPNNEFVTGVIVPVTMTLCILIFSELIPKTIGANSWKGLTNFTVKSLNILVTVLFPLVWFGEWITKILKKDKDKSVLSRADFSAMAEIGEKEGVIGKGESSMIKNLLEFKSILTKDIMTPRTVLVTAKDDTKIKDFYDANKGLRFSRIPIYKDSKDNINAYILKNEVLSNIIDGNGDAPLKSIKRELMIVNEKFPIPNLFNQFLEKREHIALVVDEFGGVDGVVSMEDTIETLLGLEIVDELDNVTDMQHQARKNWEKRAKDLGIIDKDNEDDLKK